MQTVRTLSNLSMLPLLVLAGRFALPEGDAGDKGGDDKGGAGGADKSKDGGADKGAEGGDKGEKKKDGGDDGKPPIPYSRFAEVNEQRRTAETELKTVKADVARLTTENEQLKAADKSGALTTVQNQVKELQTKLDAVEKEFEDLLEVALAPLPKEKAAIVRDIPGGARAQFAWFNKHRGTLVGEETANGEKGVKGSKHERKPGSKDEPVASSVSKSYVDTAKPAAAGKGFAGLA